MIEPTIHEVRTNKVRISEKRELEEMIILPWADANTHTVTKINNKPRHAILNGTNFRRNFIHFTKSSKIISSREEQTLIDDQIILEPTDEE